MANGIESSYSTHWASYGWQGPTSTGPASTKNERRQRLSLPTYSFEKNRYWVDAKPFSLAELTSSATPNTRKKPDVQDWFYQSVWQSNPLPIEATTKDKVNLSHLIFCDAVGWGEQLGTKLAKNGTRVMYVTVGEAFSFDGNSPFHHPS